MTPTPQTMEERFDKTFVKLEGLFDTRSGYMFKADPKAVKEFINKEIQLALDKREEGLKGKIEFLIAHNRLSEKWSDDYYRAFEDLKNFPSI